MEPGGPWRDPRQGYIYGLGSPMQMPAQQRSDPAAAGGVLKRSLGELERWQHQRQFAMQQELYLRAVRQRTAATSPAVSPLTSADIAAVLGGVPAQPFFSGSSLGGGLASPSSTLSSLTTASRAAMPLIQHHVHRQTPLVPSSAHAQTQAQAHALAVARVPAPSAVGSELSILQDLEKQLLGDDDEAEPAMSGTGSTVTSSEWEETIQRLNSITAASSPPLYAEATPNNKNNYSAAMTGSPSNSSTSTASSSASCSPPISATTSRQLLSEAAAAIADGNLETAAANLATLKRAANPRGDAEQRLVAVMVAALSSRIAPTASASSQQLADLCGAEHHTGSQLLHDITPCFRLALDAANIAIVEAVAGHRVIHLVDFDINAPQHAALIQRLADRRVPGTCLQVTAVTDPTSPFTQSLAATLPGVGERLKKLAELAGIEYHFRMISCRAVEIEASKLGCEPGEALAVNLAFALSHVPDESVSPANPRDELLRRVRALGPQVVTLVEQELNSNTAPLATRFSDAYLHYGAILDALDSTVSRDSADRARAEEAVANMSANAVGREGADRLERCEVFGKWRARFGMAGFRPVALAAGIADQVMARAGAPPPGLVVKPENGVLRLGWKQRVVAVASAWR
ncbi:hypothetical protein CFC21_024741 [Triticum aestivum]|uniref:Uncharacterized protein n=3 Tax=Triticum TaxID=4564 RepID=A0A9R1RQT7_TRITD|nr:scarecrow-like protein 8 [Triticum aestivum]KAF7010319.1 hypothetical protein CFC21_024741 [Triticum aestivum]VAH50223.1 unnamed protein product [Triticum turgidum subsp. durum]